MIIIPAIDIKNGKCFGLKKDKINSGTIFSNNPLEVAESWFSKGAELIHIIDLDGAIKGKPVNSKLILSISEKYQNKMIQVGGGIRTFDSAAKYLEAGVSRVILGTIAVKNASLLAKICSSFPNKVVLALDVLEGYIKIDGWGDETRIRPKDLLRRYDDFPLSAIIYTDISGDGMFSEVNIENAMDLARSTKFPVITSGKVSKLSQIKELVKTSPEQPGVSGVICRRSLYKKVFSLEEAIKASQA